MDEAVSKCVYAMYLHIVYGICILILLDGNGDGLGSVVVDQGASSRV